MISKECDESHAREIDENDTATATNACDLASHERTATLEIDYTIGGDDMNENPMLSPMTVESHAVIDPSSCVQVAVRVRPLLALEGDDECCVQVLRHSTSHQETKGPANSIQIGGSSGPQYTFDQVFDMETTQVQVYESRVAPLIESCLDGYNATILAYGQTGSGKTHTIMGPNPTTTASDEDIDAGVIPRAMTAIFDSLRNKKEMQCRESNADLDFQVSVQFIELYGEEIRDLLVTSTSQRNHEKLTIRDLGTDEPEVVGATQVQVSSAVQSLECLAHGMLRRVTGATAMNESSSRSHAILSVCIEQSVLFKTKADPAVSMHGAEEHIQVTRSKFNFVDLAGAERQKRTGASGQRLKEGIDINKGLSNLGNVISALGDPKKRGRSHVPYRDAKLTRLLKGSLGGNHKTLMIACVSPAAINMGESLNCLRYANRAKNIQNKAVVNVDASTRLVQDLQLQVAALASNLLTALDGKMEDIQFSRDQLTSLVGGSNIGSILKSLTAQSGRSEHPGVSVTLTKAKAELSETQRLLRQAQSYHDDAELELHTVRAHNCLLEAKLSLLTHDQHQPNDASIEKAFMDKAIEYEADISILQGALRDSELQKNQLLSWDGHDEVLDPSTDSASIDYESALVEREELTLKVNRNRLARIRKALNTGQSGENSDDLKAEGNDDPEKLKKLENKYLRDNDDDEFCQPEMLDPISAQERVKQFAAEIEEMSRSIETKERLIQQIKRNKEREISTRNFFEQKLADLQTLLEEKECERDQLRQELEIAEKQSSASKEMTELLQQKQEQIDALKRLQANYKRQTTLSPTSGVDHLSRLQSDVTLMKKRKADMQKELAMEKKHHSQEVGKLKKVVIQKDREIEKIQKISKSNADEMEKAKAMSKHRLDELTQLRKAIRDYKREAGLDPIMVGRRQVNSHSKNNSTSGADSDCLVIPASVADSIRDYFDSKVVSVVHKEALVDRLAKEWEEFFHLTTQRQGAAISTSSDVLESLDMQIQFKLENIRKIAQRLKRQELPKNKTIAPEQDRGDSFIFDQNFAKLCSRYNPDTSKSMAARVLFGMIVRERRRIAALTKVASSLDDRVQAAEKALVVSEAALRSCLEDHRQDVADLEQRQHDQIICLVDMVTEGVNDNTVESEDDLQTVVMFQKKLLVLANERVSLLEGQLAEKLSEKVTINDYKLQINELNNLVANRAEECELLKQSESDLRTALRQVRDIMSSHTSVVDDGSNGGAIEQTIDSVLYSTSKKSNESSAFSEPQARNQNRLFLSPRFKKHIELMHSSDSDYSDDDTDDVTASTSLMADLALIAKGEIPPSLRSMDVLEEASTVSTGSNTIVSNGLMKFSKPPTKHATTDLNWERSGKSTSSKPVYQTVFDRLGSPSQFTGTQKDKFHDSKPKRDRSTEEAIVADKDPCSNLFTESVQLPDSRSSNAIDRADYTKQNVFDRLQKTITHAAAIRQSETLQVDSRLNNEALTSSHDVAAHRSNHDENKRILCDDDNSAEVKYSGESRSAVDRAAYTKQNVFDRLQKTTTLAAAVRQSETLHLDSRVSTDHKPLISPLSTDSETLPTKKSEGKRSNKPERKDSSNPSVFERLTRTNTRASAKKSNKTAQIDT